MKRLIVLLIVVAGGLAAAAFAVPSNAATVNGTSISRNQFNADLNAIANSPDYQCFLNAEEAVGTQGSGTLPPVDGAGQVTGDGSHPTVTAGFASNYLDTEIDHQLVLQLAATRHVHLTAQDLSTARTELSNQISGIQSEVAQTKYACDSTAKEILASLPSSFVSRNVRFDATVSVLEEDMAGVGSTPADLHRYYEAHAAGFDNTCFTVAEYSSQSAAEAAAASVASGTPFATVAAASAGAPHQCVDLYEVVASLPAGSGLDTLPLNTVSTPIADNTTYLLFYLTSKTPTPFDKAQSEVESAVQSAGASKASNVIDAAGKKADVTVDPRYGQWKKGQVALPVTPPLTDVLNPSVNGSGT